ncbi:MAG: hypothetical protein WCF85_21875, partial [Rhodospirillaceae bacterium]
MADRVFDEDCERGAGGWLESLAGRLLDERERWGLWLPVGLGFGIALYFSLPDEPPVWLGAMVVAAA